MYIDENLRWDHHIDTFVKKISSKIAILRSLINIVPIDTLKLMYNAIVLPVETQYSKSLDGLYLENRKCMHKCTIVFKCENVLAPPYLI